jgi:hypothetical protein
VWEEGSKCVAVGIPPRWLTSLGNIENTLTINDVRTYVGVEFEYRREETEIYYSHLFADLEMKLYVADDGTTLYNQGDMEKYAVIQLSGVQPKTVIPNNAKLESVVNPMDARFRSEWDAINRYIPHIGKTLEEVEALLKYPLEAIGNEGDYEEAETNTRYFFDPGNRGLCTNVYIPVPIILPMENGVMTKAELLDYWKDVSFGWSYYEGFSQYTFLFEDVAVVISLFEENRNAVWDIAEGSAVVIRI